MSAHNSGMNIVIEFALAYLDQLVAHRFADVFGVQRPEGYVGYELSPRAIIILPPATPAPELQLPVTLEGEHSDGTRFSHDLTITFGLHAEVYENSRVRVVLSYLRVSPDEERVSEVLSGLRQLWWEVPLDFLNILDVSLEFVSSAVAVADGALAVGVGVRNREQNITIFQGDFNMNFVGTGAEISIAVEREVMEMLSRAMIQNAIERTASGEEVFEDYNIQSSEIHWERDHVRIVSEGRFNFETRIGDWWHVRVTTRGTFFVDAVGDPSSRIRMHLITDVPDDVALIGDDENFDDNFRERFEDGEADPRSIELDSFDEWSPVARFPLNPDTLGAEAFALERIEHTEHELTIHYDARVASLEPSGIMVSDELRINFSREYSGGGGCAGPIRKEEGSLEAVFTIENTGTGPLRVLVSAEPEDIFHAFVLKSRIDGGEIVSGTVALLVDYRPIEPGTYTGRVRIYHNVPDEDEISIPVEASFTTTWDISTGGVMSRAEKTIFCSWADLLMLARGFSDWRSVFDDLPYEPPYDDPYIEVFEMSQKDPRDDYEFIARSEAGELLAINGAHTPFKRIDIPVDRGATLRLEGRRRGHPTDQVQGTFFFTIMKRTIQTLGSFAINSPRALAAFEGGVCVSTEDGLTVVDTLDPWRPLAVANLDVGSLAGVAAFGRKAFAVGDKGLFILDLSDPNEPNLRQVMEQFAGACAVRRRGTQLWVAGERQLTVLDISNWEKPVPLATSPLTMPALDLAVYRGRVVVLHKLGLDIFDLSGKQLTLVAKHKVDQAGNKSLSKHGTLVSLSDTKTGTQMLDISQPKSPELVTQYSTPFWKAGLTREFAREIAYKVHPKGDGIAILRIHVNKLR